MHFNHNLNGKKLLVLAGADVHCKVVQAAKEMGVYTVVTDYLPLEASPAKQIADEAWMLDIMDIDGIVKKCKKEKIDGVLSFCIDPAQIPYQRICEKLNVPCYGTRRQFEIMTNKRKFKEYCKQHGVDVIPEYTLEDVKNNAVIYPILIKPEDSRGSRGQTVCKNKKEVSDAIAYAGRESARGGVIIEHYMLGKQDFSLSYIIIDSVPYMLKIGDRYLGRVEDNLERQHICTLLPSKSTESYKKHVEPYVKNMIFSLGIKFGAVFLQGFIEENKVYFYDPGLRFPGSDFDIVLKHATGFDPMKSMVQFALTGDITSCVGNPQNAYYLNGGVCVILSITVKSGKIGVLNGFDKIAGDSRIFSVSKRYSVGQIVPDTGDLKQRAAEIVAYLQRREDAEDFAEYIYNTVSILDENGRDMIVSKMGINIPF